MSYHQLSEHERYTTTSLLISRRSQAEIARILGRSRSTISRELRRNRSTHDGKYRAEVAHSYATARRRRERRGWQFSPQQLNLVARRVEKDWSPQQVSERLKLEGILLISHQTIYHFIVWDKKRGGSLHTHLRSAGKQRRKRHGSTDSRGILQGKRHISERPAEVETRQTIGHWEGDTMIGRDRYHCILTFVERRSGYAIIRKMRCRTAAEVVAAAAPAIKAHLSRFKTATLDNGTEFHDYKKLEQLFSVRFYFATPYHSWERGSNENLNGLIRQYLPRGCCMSELTQAQCDWIAHQLNCRPRKRLGFKSPQEVYYAS